MTDRGAWTGHVDRCPGKHIICASGNGPEGDDPKMLLDWVRGAGEGEGRAGLSHSSWSYAAGDLSINIY